MNSTHQSRILKSLFILFLTMGLNVHGLAHAKAVFGLGTCERVKKQITQNEKVIYKELRFWNSRVGTEIGSNLKNRLYKFEEKNYAKRIWKTALNNKKCFTPTQILEIDRRTNFEGTSENWFLIKLNFRSVGSGEECIGRELRKPIDLGKYGTGKGNTDPICDIPLRISILQSDYPRSLYSY